MIHSISSKSPADIGLILMRVCSGILIFVHGLGTFDPGHMQGNIAWLNDVHFPLPAVSAYLGKLTELIGGALITLGLLTRIASALLVINMLVITFILGSGQIFNQEELPFLLLILFLSLFISGAGNLSLDNLFFSGNRK